MCVTGVMNNAVQRKLMHCKATVTETSYHETSFDIANALAIQLLNIGITGAWGEESVLISDVSPDWVEQIIIL